MNTDGNGKGATKAYGVRREAKRHAAFEGPGRVRKAVSPLRCATALQKLRENQGLFPTAVLMDTDGRGKGEGAGGLSQSVFICVHLWLRSHERLG